MRDDEIDDVLKRAPGASSPVDPALLDRVTKSMGASLQPVRPLPSPAVLTAAIAAAGLGVALIGAAALRMHGIARMSGAQMGVIFPLLAMLACLAAFVSVGQMIPGSRRRMGPGTLLIGVCVSLMLAFALLFDEYRVERFWSQGVACLTAGLAQAVPAALLAFLVLRRGFAVDRMAAGLAIGTLAGLAGVTMLELHCPNFEIPHMVLWHIAVAPLSGVAVAIAMRLWRGR